MAEYINRDELLRHYDEYYCKPCRAKGNDYNGVKCRACGTGDAIETAEDIPDADVRENVRGKWIDDGFLNRKTCSICGAWIANNTGTAGLNYCPNCGANMGPNKRGEK